MRDNARFASPTVDLFVCGKLNLFPDCNSVVDQPTSLKPAIASLKLLDHYLNKSDGLQLISVVLDFHSSLSVNGRDWT